MSRRMAFLHLPPIRWLTSFYNPPIKQGISQTEFAERINMTQLQLAKIENLDCTPTLAMLNKYAKGLGLEIKLSILPLETAK